MGACVRYTNTYLIKTSIVELVGVGRALRVEPRRARAFEKYHQACFEPELFLYKDWKL